MSALGEVIFLDQASTWRDQLRQGLEAEGLKVNCLELGDNLLDILVRPAFSVRGIILGYSRNGDAGLDALHAAWVARGKQPLGPRAPALFLVTHVKEDTQLLDLLRERGVSEFIYRTDPLEKSLHQIRGRLFGDRRSSPRHPLFVPCTLALEDTQVAGTLEDVSNGGGRCVFRSRKLKRGLKVGETIKLIVETPRVRLECSVEVRSVTTHASLLGEQASVGLKFSQEGPELERSIEALVDYVSSVREASVTATGWGLG
jgi:hypothetical protein